MSSEKSFSFEGIIEHHQGVFRNYSLFVPVHILKQLPSKGRFRMEGTMNGTPFNLAIQNDKELGKYFVISTPFLRELKCKPGEKVSVQFKLVSHEQLEIPEEFLAALEQDPDGHKIFYSFTIGLQRGLVHYIKSAKQIDTRIKRSLELIQKMKNGELHTQKAAKDKKK
jgi:hypothetical protein